MSLDRRPVMLIGTFDKIEQYSHDIFGQLSCEFRRVLATSTALLVCGYGFRDKGINNQIIEWLYSSRSRRLVVIHPSPVDLAKSARPAIGRGLGEWEKAGILRLVAKGVQDVSADDVAASLD